MGTTLVGKSKRDDSAGGKIQLLRLDVWWTLISALDSAGKGLEDSQESDTDQHLVGVESRNMTNFGLNMDKMLFIKDGTNSEEEGLGSLARSRPSHIDAPIQGLCRRQSEGAPDPIHSIDPNWDLYLGTLVLSRSNVDHGTESCVLVCRFNRYLAAAL